MNWVNHKHNYVSFNIIYVNSDMSICHYVVKRKST